MVNSLQMGLIAEPVTYKLDSGWADLTAAQVTAIAQAVGGHVKACFRAERAVATQLEAMDDPRKRRCRRVVSGGLCGGGAG